MDIIKYATILLHIDNIVNNSLRFNGIKKAPISQRCQIEDLISQVWSDSHLRLHTGWEYIRGYTKCK